MYLYTEVFPWHCIRLRISDTSIVPFYTFKVKVMRNCVVSVVFEGVHSIEFITHNYIHKYVYTYIDSVRNSAESSIHTPQAICPGIDTVYVLCATSVQYVNLIKVEIRYLLLNGERTDLINMLIKWESWFSSILL